MCQQSSLTDESSDEVSDVWREYQGAHTGTDIECEGWRQEAALRMLNNNLDPEVAEKPEELVVYGGTGRAARSWDDYDVIVEELRNLADDETLLVQSGRAVGRFKTHERAPRVLICSSRVVVQSVVSKLTSARHVSSSPTRTWSASGTTGSTSTNSKPGER